MLVWSCFDWARDAGVDHHEARAGFAREHAHRGAARDEVRDHLRRHFLRIGGDALGGDTVVAGRDDDDGLEALRHEAADARDPGAEVFEPAEAAARLRLRVETSACLLVRRHSSLSARPATTKYASSAASAQIAFTRPSTSR